MYVCILLPSWLVARGCTVFTASRSLLHAEMHAWITRVKVLTSCCNGHDPGLGLGAVSFAVLLVSLELGISKALPNS